MVVIVKLNELNHNRIILLVLAFQLIEMAVYAYDDSCTYILTSVDNGVIDHKGDNVDISFGENTADYIIHSGDYAGWDIQFTWQEPPNTINCGEAFSIPIRSKIINAGPHYIGAGITTNASGAMYSDHDVGVAAGQSDSGLYQHADIAKYHVPNNDSDPEFTIEIDLGDGRSTHATLAKYTYTKIKYVKDQLPMAPKTLQECEMYTSKICGTWTLEGDHYIAKWDNGAVATLNVEYWGILDVVLSRYDSAGPSAGLSARYEGQIDGNTIRNGVVTWTLQGHTWKGTWKGTWEAELNYPNSRNTLTGTGAGSAR
jgi:hypothetical protein